MKKFISFLSLALILASTTAIANQQTVDALEANDVVLSAEQADAIRTAEGDDALISAITDLIAANASNPLAVKAITRAAIEAHPNLVVAVTNYAISVAPSARTDICIGALEQTRYTAIASELPQQELQCGQVYKFANSPGTRPLESNNDVHAASAKQ